MTIRTGLICLYWLSLSPDQAQAQQIPNGDFRKWENGCPVAWYCNNDADCPGKVMPADKQNGGARLTIMHCFNPAKDDRSNNVSLNYDDLKAMIQKNKKVRISFDYSWAPVSGDAAYIKIDIDLADTRDAAGNPINASFEYNGNKNGWLKAGTGLHSDCILNFDPGGRNYNCPDDVMAESIRTTFGIMPATGAKDVHKGSVLIINHVKFILE